VRHEDLKIINLQSGEDVQRLKDLLCDITGVRFVSADLDAQIVEFDMFQDFDDLTLTDIQCRLRDAGFDAGTVVEGETCTLRLRGN